MIFLFYFPGVVASQALSILLLACFALSLLTYVAGHMLHIVVWKHQFIIRKFSPDSSYSVFHFIKISVAQAAVLLQSCKMERGRCGLGMGKPTHSGITRTFCKMLTPGGKCKGVDWKN